MSQNLHKNNKKFVQSIPHISSNFCHSFTKISKKYFQYFFIISTKSVSIIKLLGCFLIIFPKLIQHLLHNLSNNFLKIFTRLHKNVQNTSTYLVQNSSKIFYKFPTFLQSFEQIIRNSFYNTHLTYIFSQKFSKCF